MESITVIPRIVDVPVNLSLIPDIDKHASPDTHLMSITTSATSFKFLPEECLLATLFENSLDVNAITFMPIFFASNAISTTPAFLPEIETIIIVSSFEVFSSPKYSALNPSTLSWIVLNLAFGNKAR